MTDIDSIFEQLTEIRNQLDALPADATEERAVLELRRQELHAAAAGQEHDQRSTEEIELELASLRERLDQIEGLEVDIATQHGGSLLEASGAAVGMELNRQVEEGQGAEALRDRIKSLEQELEARS